MVFNLTCSVNGDATPVDSGDGCREGGSEEQTDKQDSEELC